MDRINGLKTWAIIIGLLIFTGAASAAWLWFSNLEDDTGTTRVAEVEQQSEPITVSVGDYVLGEDLLGIDFISQNIEGLELNPWLVLIGAAVVVSVLIGAIGTGITLVSLFTSRQVSKVYEDERYQEAQAKLQQHDKELIDALNADRPVATPAAKEVRTRRSMLVTALLFVMLVWITGNIFGVAFFGTTTWEIFGLSLSPIFVINIALILVTVGVIAILFRVREPEELDISKTDNNPVNWNYVWIILSGALIFGLGTGLVIAMGNLP